VPDAVDRSRLVVLAGPTAVGKGTVASCVRDKHPDIWISVSVTTRPARPGEVDGVHYHFISDEEFDRLVAENGLLEWAVVHRAARYGRSISSSASRRVSRRCWRSICRERGRFGPRCRRR
jgi:guanylate kinase